MKYQDILESYKKVTLVKFSEFGYPISIQMRLEDLQDKDYAQYKDCLFITGTPKRKRHMRRYILRPYESFILYSGWIDINNTEKVISENDRVKVISLGMCFDKSNLINAKTNINAEVIMKSNL